MASLLNVLNIAATSLTAQTAGMNVTGDNVANATTPGYVKRTAILQDQVLGTQAGGVQFAGVQRQFDRFAFARVAQEGGLLGAAQARSSALASAQSVIAPASGSIDTQISAFFAAAQGLTANPSDSGARQQLLTTASSLAQSISGTAASLAQQSSDMLTQAQGVASSVNQSLSQIAKLDDQIQQATAQGDPAADLRDQRDQLVQSVATAMGAQTVEDARGNFTLLSSGVALVSGGGASQVGVTTDPSGALQITVRKAGGAPTDVTGGVQSGTLGGIREARDTDLAAARQGLDQLAYDLSNAVNKVHASGYGADGVTGRNLFVAPAQVAGAAAAMALDGAMVGHPERVAAAATSAELPGGNTNALALAALSSQPLGSANMDPTQRFDAIAAGVGSAASSASSEVTLRTATSAQATTLEQSSEGVNTDEEMVALSQYQAAFEASQKVLTVANQLLGELMQEL